MSTYSNFTACATDFVEQFNEFAKNNQGATTGEFFDHSIRVKLVNDLVVTYHSEILTTTGNNFLAPERVPAGIVSLAKKRGVKFPRGFSIKNDEHSREMFVQRVKDYRESSGLTEQRVQEIRKRARTQQ